MSAVVKTIERKADPDVVVALEAALENARSGKTTGVLILEQNVQNCHWTSCGLGDRFKVIGYLTHAAFIMSYKE